MIPDEIISKLKKGSENFVNNNLTQRDHSEQRCKSTIGKTQKQLFCLALITGC